MSVLDDVFVRVVEQTIRLYGYEGLLRVLGKSPKPDERLAKLSQVERDLQAAIEAVHELKRNAEQSKTEAEELQAAVSRLKEDKATAEQLVSVPEEAFARMLSRATAKGRGRGLLEGVCIGLATGFVSSLMAWYLTK